MPKIGALTPSDAKKLYKAIRPCRLPGCFSVGLWMLIAIALLLLALKLYGVI